ncbi:MAG: DUF2163 domain-containing protein, partial [Pseudomonadota bacterium]
MRAFASNFDAHISGVATTLCFCWEIERADGVRQGFTDHDRDLSFGGLAFAARSALT